ncbi:MAG: leucyl/phenylalanyl-tRNA--protein transferase [Lysobacterales bacterium]
MIRLPWLDPDDPATFPPAEHALRNPDGLLAAGGDLSMARLLAAYARGIFPWYSPGEPILWWSPDPRCVFDTARPHVSRRMDRWLAGSRWSITADLAFDEVIDGCAAPRPGLPAGTWIVPEMRAAYGELHRAGLAHSIEVHDDAGLVGGLYGVALGKMFFGESMFSRATNGSKVALLAMCRLLESHGFPLLDAQLVTPHLLRVGARAMPRGTFCAQVAQLVERPCLEGSWADLAFPRSAAELRHTRG